MGRSEDKWQLVAVDVAQGSIGNEYRAVWRSEPEEVEAGLFAWLGDDWRVDRHLDGSCTVYHSWERARVEHTDARRAPTLSFYRRIGRRAWSAEA